MSQRSRELRTLPETAATPVVAVTAFAMKDDRERFLAAGFDGYLEKPIDVRELRVLRVVVPRSRTADRYSAVTA